MSFQLTGHTEDGAPIIQGDGHVPPAGEWVFVLLLGAVLTLGLAGGGAVEFVRGNFLVGGFGLLLGILIGGAVLRGGVWWLQMRQSIRKCTTLQVVAQQLGVTEQAAKRQMHDQGIQVEAVVNGTEIYDLPTNLTQDNLLIPSRYYDGLVRPSQPSGDDSLPRPLYQPLSTSDTADFIPLT